MLRKIKSFKGLFLSSLSAALLILSFPRFNLEFLAWFGFVPVFFALRNKSLKQAFFLFFITGIIFWSGIIYWLAHVTLAGTIVLVLYLALYFALFGLIIRPCTKHSTPYSLIFIPSVWVLLEYLRSHIFTGFPWALLGYSQYLNLPFIQIADITGVWGVSFLVMMVNVAIVEISWSLAKGLRPRLKAAVILLVLFLSLTLSYGYFRLSAHPPKQTQHSMRVSVIQGNISQELKWDPAARAYILDRYAQLTEQAAADKPDLIIWPEASAPGLLGEDGAVFQEIFGLSKKAKTPLLVGAVSTNNDKYYNSVLLVEPPGAIVGRYDKIHLVPFGEYIPLKNVFSFLETIAPIGDIQRGTKFTIFENQPRPGRAPERFAVLICFEDLFPELSREFVKRGAGFLVNITNDAWYKKTNAAHQHFQACVFRAVENRVFLARSANTGVSGFINPYGKIVSLVSDDSGENIFISGYNTQEIIPAAGASTFYTRYGDIFPLACFLFALYGIIPFLKKRKP